MWDLQSLLSVSEHALPCSSQGLRQLPAASPSAYRCYLSSARGAVASRGFQLPVFLAHLEHLERILSMCQSIPLPFPFSSRSKTSFANPTTMEGPEIPSKLALSD
jgi:hypothetical protein